ncbi:MAG: cytidine deaminase [bacterium]
MSKLTEMKALLRLAYKATNQSYSPYSRFPVGAALVTEKGEVFTGCNVENASYGLTLCAERVALVKAISEGKRKFAVMAVVGGKGKPIRPCGACLQMLAEFCGSDFPMILASLDDHKQFEVVLLGDLLPQGFKIGEHSES